VDDRPAARLPPLEYSGAMVTLLLEERQNDRGGF